MTVDEITKKYASPKTVDEITEKHRSKFNPNAGKADPLTANERGAIATATGNNIALQKQTSDALVKAKEETPKGAVLASAINNFAETQKIAREKQQEAQLIAGGVRTEDMATVKRQIDRGQAEIVAKQTADNERLNAEMRTALSRLSSHEIELLDKYNDLSGAGYTAVSTGLGREKLNNPQAEAERQLLAMGYSPEKIRELASYRQRQTNAETMQAAVEGTAEFAEKAPVLATITSSALSVPASIMGGKEVIENIFNVNKPIDTNSGNLMPQAIIDSIRNTVMQNHEWKVGETDVFDFLYSTATSAMDSLLAATIGGKLGGLMLGTGVAASTMRDVAERGGTNKQAITAGLVAGTFEGLFESLSIGQLKSMQEVDVKNVRDIFLNIAKAMGVNATEEGATEIANVIYDTVALGGLSEAAQQVKAYMSNGYSYDEALYEVLGNKAKQVTSAVMSGALMGLGFGGGSMALNARNIAEDIKNESDAVMAADAEVAAQRKADTEAVMGMFGERARAEAQAAKLALGNLGATTERSANSPQMPVLPSLPKAPVTATTQTAETAQTESEAATSTEKAEATPRQKRERVMDVIYTTPTAEQWNKDTAEDYYYNPQTLDTALGAPVTPEEYAKRITTFKTEGSLYARRITNDESLKKSADKIASEGYEKAYAKWLKDRERGVFTKDHVAMGAMLYSYAVNAESTPENIARADEVFAAYVEMMHTAGQVMQAGTLLRQLSPQARLTVIENTLNNHVKRMNGKVGKTKGAELTINQDLKKAYAAAKTEEEQKTILDQIYAQLAEDLGTNAREKLNAWRYLSMLANPRTHIRNIVSNVAFQPMRMAKNLVKYAIQESIGESVGAEKTTAVLTLSTEDVARIKAAELDFAAIESEIRGEAKYDDNSVIGKVLDQRSIFGNAFMEKLRKMNFAALEKEDLFALRLTYVVSLAEYMKANNITAAQWFGERSGKPYLEKFSETKAGEDVINAARDYAIREAKKATFRDRNKFSDTIAKMGNSDAAWVRVITEGLLPFKRTPANVLVRAFEYSPIGVTSTIKQISDLKKDMRNPNVEVTAEERASRVAQIIDSAASNITGTAALALGVFLRHVGAISGGDEDKDVAEYNEMTGKQNYSFNIDGIGSISLEFLAPSVIPLLMGAKITDLGKNNGLSFAEILDVATSIASPMVELSMLQGINDVLSTVSFNDGDVGDALIAAVSEMGYNYLSQFIPTVFGQVERTLEPIWNGRERQKTYTNPEGQLPTNMQYFISQALNRVPIPGVDYNQVDYIDAWGRTEDTGGIAGRAFNNFLNPSTVSRDTSTPYDEKLTSLAKKYPSLNILPDITSTRVKVRPDGAEESRYLSEAEWEDYAKNRGSMHYDLVSYIIDNYGEDLSEAQLAEALDTAYTFANEYGKSAAVDYTPTTKWIAKALDDDVEEISETIIERAIESVRKDEKEKKGSNSAGVWDLLVGN